MAGKKLTPNGKYQYVFNRAGVLNRPFYLTFENEEEGDAYAARLEALLERGIVPSEFQREEKVTLLREALLHKSSMRTE
ncbi:MAG: hypothetical protein VB138_14440 [Burkholderia sp.]